MNLIFRILFPLVMVFILVLIPWFGVWALDLRKLFGIYIPYAAIIIFILGTIVRVIGWARSPNPFRIPTTAGQQKSLPWVKQNKLDNPSSGLGVIGRMLFEILLFRSLFRNTRMEFREGPKIGYEWEKWLWIAALAFHYSFLVVVLRHLRFFTEPIPGFVNLLESLDGLFEVGFVPYAGISVPWGLSSTVPVILMSGILLVAALLYLFLRRIFVSHTRYISLTTDFFPLFLIIGIATTGIMMRYIGVFMDFVFKVDWLTVPIVNVKELAIGLITFNPIVPDNIGTMFFIHLFLVCCLLAYFPFSKLMHMGGIFLTPTRVLANNNRAIRHVNPWNYPVKVHSYEEYEEEFREKMIEAGLPVDKMPDTGSEEAEEDGQGSQEEAEKE